MVVGEFCDAIGDVISWATPCGSMDVCVIAFVLDIVVVVNLSWNLFVFFGDYRVDWLDAVGFPDLVIPHSRLSLRLSYYGFQYVPSSFSRLSCMLSISLLAIPEIAQSLLDAVGNRTEFDGEPLCFYSLSIPRLPPLI